MVDDRNHAVNQFRLSQVVADGTPPCSQTSIAELIETVFVHAADQPYGDAQFSPLTASDDTSSSGTSALTPGTSSIRSSIGSQRRLSTATPATSPSTKTLQRHDSGRGHSASQRLIPLDTRPTQQMQMLANFLDAYFPNAEAKAGMASRRSYLAVLPDVDVSRTPILRVAIDTLCFAHIGALTGDARLIRESQASYGKVLSSLIMVTRRPASEAPLIEPRALVTSIMLLCLYDDAIAAPIPGQSSWAAHYWGCQQLLLAYGPSFLAMSDPFDRLIYWNLRMPLYMLGVAKRKAVMLGLPEWIALADAIKESRGPLTDFYRVGGVIPALLERLDDLLASPPSDHQTAELCAEIASVRAKVLEWHTSQLSKVFLKAFEEPVPLNVTDCEAFDIKNEEQCFMTSSDTFPYVIRFRHPGNSLKSHTLCSLMLLVLDCTILRLLHFRPAAAAFVAGRTRHSLERDSFTLACDLARSTYHYCRPDSLAMADFTWFLNEVALNFFQEVGAIKEMGWCQAVQCATTLRVARLKRTVHPRTLCRMGDIGPDFAAVTRYKSPTLGMR